MNSLQTILSAIVQGMLDSMRGFYIVLTLDKEIQKQEDERRIIYENQYDIGLTTKGTRSKSKRDEPAREKPTSVKKRFMQCCLLNGFLFIASIFSFHQILLPTIAFCIRFLYGSNASGGEQMWQIIKSKLHFIFAAVWVIPLFLLSRLVNSLWFQDIADLAYKFRKGRPLLMSSVSKLVADTIFSLTVQALFMIQSIVVNEIPFRYVGAILYFVHMCVLNSLYSFEYKWVNMGWELHKRLNFIEQNWPYFIGFGIPLTIFTQWSTDFYINGAIFAILFPIFILSGNEAIPMTGSTDFPLRLFSLVVAVTNKLFSRTMKRKSPNPSPIQTADRVVMPQQRIGLQSPDYMSRILSKPIASSTPKYHTPTPSTSSGSLLPDRKGYYR